MSSQYSQELKSQEAVITGLRAELRSACDSNGIQNQREASTLHILQGMTRNYMPGEARCVA